MKNKIIDIDTLSEKVTEDKKSGKKVVSTSGCFDILHAGHVIYLEEAKKKGDILVVLLNSDDSVRKLKGKERPIVSQRERAIVMAGLECVDYVCIFEEQTPCEFISRFKPDIVVKGGDYEGMHIPEMDVLSIYGGDIKYISFVNGCSTTNIIERIKKFNQGD